MIRKFKTGKDNRANYIYYSADGSKITLTPGENGVTEADIAFLHQMDDEEHDNDRREEDGQLRFSQFSGESDGKEFVGRQLMIDPCAEIFEIMEKINQVKQLNVAIQTLLPQQKTLLDSVYVKKVTIAEIARREGVTEGAIRDRLRKIYKKLKKILE
jgi:RNA polymerase sigma factor (sigma-70 family)